jgi:hypothetical protein
VHQKNVKTMSDFWADLKNDSHTRFDFIPSKMNSYCERTKSDCTKNLKMCKTCKYTFCSSHISNMLCDECKPIIYFIPNKVVNNVNIETKGCDGFYGQCECDKCE